MAFQPVTGVAEFRCLFTGEAGGDLEGLTAQYTYYAQRAAPWDIVGLTQVAQAIETQFAATGRPLLAAAWRFLEIRARDLTSEFAATHTEPVGQVGTRAGQVAPPSVTVVTRVKGTPGSPPKVGWMHAPFGVEADIDGERWTVGLFGDTSVHHVATHTAIEASAALAQVVLVSRFAGTEPDPTARRPVQRAAGVFSTAQAVSTRSLIGSQRNRRF